MEPTDFPESNRILHRPANWPEDVPCGDAVVYTDGFQCVSKWRMTWRERIHCLLRGTIWVLIASGDTQPPIAVSAQKTVFLEEAGDG